MKDTDAVAALLAMRNEKLCGIRKTLLIGRTDQRQIVAAQRIESAREIGFGCQRQQTRCAAIFEKAFDREPQRRCGSGHCSREIREARNRHGFCGALCEAYERSDLRGQPSNRMRHILINARARAAAEPSLGVPCEREQVHMTKLEGRGGRD